jgi:hypothetical protein
MIVFISLLVTYGPKLLGNEQIWDNQAASLAKV